ncbi:MULTISPECIES: BCCT family transporter [unclassified Psychrobacter]|uniref:BCCT family transporter n=1 Tax=unclassified Psychrobacter TaxID=196806 RepID=UPI000946E623|nr:MULTISPECIES: BCCT family transporter [unclassified Psychrobacter]OLF41283.1 choline transporter [Psychrobacter sp. Rd 27.2]PJX24965.1 choline transporter [Psychrobacter sp. L7]
MDHVKVGRVGPFPRVSKPVFLTSVVLITLFIIFGALFNQQAETVFNQAKAFVSLRFGWFFIVVINTTLLMSVYMILSRYGDIRLGHQNEEPEYKLLSWIGMLFSAGIGIGLLYWGTAEPLYHYMAPPLGEGETVASAKLAMNISFLHYGIHVWALYGMVALALAYFHYRRGLPLAIRSTLYPILGKRIYGGWGHTVDTLAVFGTMFGVVTTLGLGVLQINSGLESLFGLPNNTSVQIILIAIITVLAGMSLFLGLDKGIKRLSDINIFLTIILLSFVIILGPTQFIFNSFVENIGNYVHQVIPLGFWTESYEGQENWQASWTIFYWAWWISWSPFVGVFVARISRGRTIREFTLGVLLIPVAILFLWFTAFGGSAVHMELLAAASPDLLSPGLVEAVRADTGSAIFKLMESYPLTSVFNLLIVVMIVLWFVTSSDSASFVIDMLTSGGDTDPPKVQRLFWAGTEGVIAAVLLAAGGLTALQAASIVSGLPFAVVILVMMYSLLRGLSRDHLILYRQQQWFLTEESAEHNSANELPDEDFLKGPIELKRED